MRVGGIVQIEFYERKVIWYEQACDIIHQTHFKLSHSMYARTHKLAIGVIQCMVGFTSEYSANLHKALPRLSSKHQATYGRRNEYIKDDYF